MLYLQITTRHFNGDLPTHYRTEPDEEPEYEEEEGGEDEEALPWDTEDVELDSDDEETSPLELFLAINGLDEYLPYFSKEDVDLEALMLLTDDDLKHMGLPLGPRRKLAGAVKQRQYALDMPGGMRPSLI